MSFSRFSPILPALFAFGLLAAPAQAATPVTEDSGPRFSSTLSPEQQKETGLDQLTSDNVAVIDALIRLDVAATRMLHNNIRTTRFSQRRTEHERDIAGLDHLSDAQLAKLDQFVALRIPAPARPLYADLPFASLSIEPAPVTTRRPTPEIHGSFSLTYGWSKGGSVRGADSTITMVDPKHRFAVTVGYSEYRGKGLAPYPYSIGNDDPPYYRPVPLVLPEDR